MATRRQPREHAVSVSVVQVGGNDECFNTSNHASVQAFGILFAIGANRRSEWSVVGSMYNSSVNSGPYRDQPVVPSIVLC